LNKRIRNGNKSQLSRLYGLKQRRR
jgi:hypothetical protein